ncbi:DUF397 domain-containing protein [Streptomyces alkaliterrae]|uniref:DUF397 domain-containing protein n=1 Tax=Streptomyces alkaliterrae TaxID=2213162 RepID=A0A5P0YUX1_9ACTN|nr:DUF397 domain-containing protein [Streptomyces alkaliterrae]MBB1261174.1 DUF397 domain-containing protein [Streptomyces alkaliterrae]MQS04095.1 DUF397 domain-containing protein [Streptomyces alkaliterrae]
MSTSELVWFKSSHSGSEGDACVEVARGPQAVHVRDSKERHGPQIAVSPVAWADFVSFSSEV